MKVRKRKVDEENYRSERYFLGRNGRMGMREAKEGATEGGGV
jgi:hypothetical protein